MKSLLLRTKNKQTNKAEPAKQRTVRWRESCNSEALILGAKEDLGFDARLCSLGLCSRRRINYVTARSCHGHRASQALKAPAHLHRFLRILLARPVIREARAILELYVFNLYGTQASIWYVTAKSLV